MKKIVYAVVWTKKGAKENGTNENDVAGLYSELSFVQYPFFDKRSEAMLCRDLDTDLKVVKMEITYKQV